MSLPFSKRTKAPYPDSRERVHLPLTIVCLLSVAAIMTLVCYYIPPVTYIDDTFSQYALGNGFAAATAKVTYFEYSFLFYERFFAWLYRCFPALNAMTLFYLFLHGICAVMVSRSLFRLSRHAALIALAPYLLLFLIPSIIHISYTGTAGHCIATALLLCAIPVIQKKVPGLRALFPALLLLVLGAGLRVHILLPLLAAASPLLWLIKDKAAGRRLLFLALLTGAGISGGILLHRHDYRQHIPDWPEVRATMDATFYLSNHGNLESPAGILKDSHAAAFLPLAYTAFSYDQPAAYDSLMRRYKQHAIATRSFGEKTQAVFQLLIQTRKPLFFLLLVILLLVINPHAGRKYKLVALSSGLISTAIIVFMAFSFKIPERVWMPLLLSAFLICSALLCNAGGISKPRYIAAQMIMLLLLAIQGIAFYKLRQENKALAARFVCNARFLQAHRETLFIELSNGSFPLDGFPALSSPAAYPLENICLGFFFNTALRYRTLQRFGYKNAWEAISQNRENKVMVIGDTGPRLLQYIQQSGMPPVSFLPFLGAAGTLRVTIPRAAPAIAYSFRETWTGPASMPAVLHNARTIRQ